jgi:hypothetical protein
MMVSSHLRRAAGVGVLAAGLLTGAAGGTVAGADPVSDAVGSAASGGDGANAARPGSITANNPVGNVTDTVRRSVPRATSTLGSGRPPGQQSSTATSPTIKAGDTDTSDEATVPARILPASDSGPAAAVPNPVAAVPNGGASVPTVAAPVPDLVPPVTNVGAPVTNVAAVPNLVAPVSDVLASVQDTMPTSVASAVVPLAQSPSDLSFLLGIAGVEPVGDGLGDADGAGPGGAVGASVASQGLLVLPFAGVARGPVAGNPTGVATLDVIALGRASALSGMAPRATQDVIPMGEQSYFPWTSDLLLRASLWALAAVALPGIAGLVILTAAGVRLSYGPLKPISHDGQPALSDWPDRGPSGLVRSVSFIGVRRRVSRVVRPRRR